ncbi:ABC transporter substrate-binding protein [Nocardiopsis lucentensis]|uniref:ABC transporter substrate-binding protein n=1 Tax=Nocardiopsis lucentensis TaxID=53441 RepID=UPI0003499713|nr:ABC transporter substrate-binding protein [Nocardiopsis lucentensis]
MTKRLAAAGTALVFLVPLAACGADPGPAADPAAEQEPGYLAVADDSLEGTGTLRVDLDYDTAEAAGLDPRTADVARSWSLMGLSYDTLVEVGPEFEFLPSLAESWETPDPTTYVFTLRDDAVFSNGRPMTARDVRRSLEFLLESESTWAAQLGPVESVEETGEHEVTVHLDRPHTALLGALANTPAGILPMEEVDDGTVDVTTEMIGTGPYVATNHAQDESWTFESNEHYWGDPPAVERLEISIVEDEFNRAAALRDGSSDFAYFNNVDTLDQLAAEPAARVVFQENTDFYYLILNSADPDSPLSDDRVRFAVNAAVDRTQLAELALGGHARPTGVAPAALPDACPAGELPSARIGDDEIAEILEEAGVTEIELSLVTFNSETAPGQIAQVVQQQLAGHGLSVDIDIVDDASFGAALYSGSTATVDMGVSWYAGYGDAGMVSRWWNTDTAAFTADFMAGDPAVNDLVVQVGETPRGPEREEALTDLCTAVDERSEVVPLVTRPSVIGYRTDAVSPTLHSVEGYGDILRNITDFRLVSS